MAKEKGQALLNELRGKYLGDFIKLWQRFYALLEEGTRTENVSDEQDDEFLQVQSNAVQLLQMLCESMGSDISFHSRVQRIFADTPSMQLLHQESPVRISDLRSQWNEVLIAATKLSGGLRAGEEN